MLESKESIGIYGGFVVSLLIRNGKFLFSKKEELPVFESKKKISFFEKKQQIIVTALKGNKAVYRELPSSFFHLSRMKKAIPFQIESLIPFPKEQAVVATVIDKRIKKTFLVGTTKEELRGHITKFPMADVVSVAGEGLGNYLLWAFPEKEKMMTIQGGVSVVVQGRSIVFMQGYEEGEEESMKAYLEKKFGPQFFWVETLPKEAIAMGLALIGTSPRIQFSLEEYETVKRKEAFNRLLFFGGALSLFFTVLFGVLGWVFLDQKEKGLGIQQGDRFLSAKERVSFLEEVIHDQSKELLLGTPPYRVSDLMAWLGGLDLDFEIRELEYKLEQFPKCNNDSFLIKLFIKYEALDIGVAHKVRDFIKNQKGLVDDKRPFLWRPTDQGYELSFFLQEESFS